MNINELNFEAAAGWSSIISLGLALISLYLIGTIRSNVIASRRKTRLRQLLGEIKTIPDDATPLSKASKSKFTSLERNLPSGYAPFWTPKNKTVRAIKVAIKSEDIPSVKEGVHDFVSYSEDL